MATLPSKAGAVTLLDFAKRLDPNGSVANVIELLNQSNEILYDALFVEANGPTAHRTTVRTGIPQGTWRKMYQGVQPAKSQTAQVDDAIGMLENRSEIDCALADLNGNTNAFRLSEADAIIEGMNQQMAQTLIYGDQSVNPERFTGLAARYNQISGGPASKQNIIDAGGSASNNTSVWLVVWGQNTICALYPKGSQAGLIHKDLGEIDAFDASNNRYRAYADIWQWKVGLCVRDWRYAVRICNVDINDLTGQTGTQANTASTWLVKLMIKAMARIPSMGKGNAVFYASRTVKEMLSVGAIDKNQNALAIQPAVNQFGQVQPGSVAGRGTGIAGGTLTLNGVPIRTVDALLTNEARVV